MAGDYSRQLFDVRKHYSGVRMQQGRVQLDADWNEQVEVQLHRVETEAIDVIGHTGVPKKNDGFKIGATANGRDLTISAGRIFVEGLLCELDTAATFTDQPFLPNPESTVLTSPPTSPPGGRQLDLGNGSYLVYLDAWQREITALDDPLIREVALGGPDTTTRLQTVFQIKLLPIHSSPPASPPGSPPTGVNCKTPVDFPAPTTGTLNARTQAPAEQENVCLLPPSAGYNRLENQLYRVEVHTGGSLAQTTFKWSRDNASVDTTIKQIDGNVVTVSETGKDELLAFGGGQWVEILDEESTLKGTPNPLIQIEKLGPGPNDITLKTSVATLANRDGLKLLRWDQTVTAATTSGISAALSPWIELEGGIQVQFSAGQYHAGDYWLIPARTATGEIEWPPFEIPNTNPIAQPPKGIHHHFCRLALIESVSGTVKILEDCRKRFPTLTEICAEDVCFDNGGCLTNLANAKTVQDALDVLCHQREGGCTLVATPASDLQALFDSIPDGGHAQICFQVGSYQLPRTVKAAKKGHLKIAGCGAGTQIIAASAEAAFAFDTCASVTVRDIYAESGLVGSGAGGPAEHLNGALTFINCGSVAVQGVSLKCGAGALRGATCITVRNDASTPRPVRIQNCDLSMGHQQEGVLLVNVQRAQIEDNVLSVYAKPDRLKLPQLIKDPQQRAGVRTLLISGAHLGAPTPPGGKTNISLTSGNQVIQFKTHTSLTKAWQPLLAANPPTGVTTNRGLLAFVTKLADRILLDDVFRNRLPAFKALLDALLKDDRAVGSQGIAVAGESAEEVRVINNNIAGTLRGIHVGLSSPKVPVVRDLAGVATITGNTIAIVLPADAGKRDRHGIFVGNCRSLLIENNNVRLERLAQSDTLVIDGIRVWGVLGDRALLTQNHLFSADGNPKRSFDFGININPVATVKPVTSLWLVTMNVAPSKQSTVRTANGAVSTANVP